MQAANKNNLTGATIDASNKLNETCKLDACSIWVTRPLLKVSGIEIVPTSALDKAAVALIMIKYNKIKI